MALTTLQRYNILRKKQLELTNKVSVLRTQLNMSKSKLDEVTKEQELIAQSLQALKDVKPIIANNAIQQCERLANTALRTIFNLDKVIVYSANDAKFLLKDPEGNYEALKEQGGGIITVISLIFNLFLLKKLNSRQFLMFDEAFYAISDAYMPAFMEFLHQLCKDLELDLLLISHDVRISPDMVDHIYVINNGISSKVK